MNTSYLTKKNTSSKVISSGRCPECAKYGRDLSEDNLKTYDDGHSYCFGCDTYFPANRELEHFVTESFSYEYLAHRGISRDTFTRYGVKTKINQEGKPVADGFIYPNGAVKVRNLGKKEFYWEQNGKEASKAGLFGQDKFSSGSHKYVTITEGEYDALALHQVLGGGPVVSVQSAASAHRDCAHSREWLNSFERIYLAFDGDDAGREAAASVANLFDYNRVFFVKFTRFKDANDYLQNGAGDELRQIWWNSKKYLPEGIKSTFAEFEDALNSTPTMGMQLYPSAILNDMTYGVRTSEVVLVTAQEGVGKTELLKAIEYKALKETDHAIGAIYLEETQGRHLQSLAGIELQGAAHLPDSGFGRDEISAALKRVVGRDDRLHLYSHFGSDDPRILEDNIRFLVSARGCRIVFLDHITMVVSGLAGEDERKALDYLSTRLKMMTVELDFALVMASHVNDDGKTRGSRMISKTADIHIHLDRDTMAFDPLVRSTTVISMPKNRPISKTGPAGTLIFNPSTQQYKDPANDNFPQTDLEGIQEKEEEKQEALATAA